MLARSVASILTQPDDEGRQHPVAYESRKLTVAERNYPAHVLELLAVVHALRVFKHYLLGSGAPRPGGCRSDFDLRTDNQAITWLKTNRHLNKMYVRWLDEIEDFWFDVMHLPGARNPADPLTRRGFADGQGPAASTGDPDPESQQELFSRLGRDAPSSPHPSAALADIRAGWAANRRVAAVTFAAVREEGEYPSIRPRGRGGIPPRVLVCLWLSQGRSWTWERVQQQRRHRFLAPAAYVRTCPTCHSHRGGAG